MNFGSLPQDPTKRKAIFVLSDASLRNLENQVHSDAAAKELYYHKEVSLLNADALSPEDNSIPQTLRTLLTPGNLLVQNPYDSSNYVDVREAYLTFAQKKWSIFATVWGFLAAKRVFVKTDELKVTSSNTKGAVNLMHNIASGSLKGEREVIEKIKKKMSLERKYNKPNGKVKVEQARAYISKHQWLFANYDLEGIIDLLEAEIPISSDIFSINITQESQTNLNLALSLNIPATMDVDAKIKQAKQEVFDFSLKTVVEFWQPSELT